MDINFSSKENIKINVVRGIYFLFRNEKIVYVGQSEDIFKRVHNHLNSKIFDSWNFIEFQSEDLNEIEANYILLYKPEYNKSIPVNKIWISQGMLKDKYSIGRIESNRCIRDGSVQCIIFNKIKYIKGFKYGN